MVLRVDGRKVLRLGIAVLFAFILLALLPSSLHFNKPRSGDRSIAEVENVKVSIDTSDTLAGGSGESVIVAPDQGSTVPDAAPDPAPPVSVSLAASSNPQLHVVVAHHSEEPYYIRTWTDNLRTIPYVQELGLKVIIYTKGPETDLTVLKEVSGAEEVFRLPNIGREGGTYLHHLLSVYDDPPQFLMVTQSYIKKAQQEKGEHTGELKPWLYDRLKTKFGHDTGFMSLDRKHDICYCGHCTDMGRDDFYPLWPQIYTMLQHTVCQELEGHVLSFNGHFIVSRKRILARPKAIYEYLKELVDAPEDHWIHAEPKPQWFEKEKGKSTPSNPKFGHTLERLWHILFNCTDPADMIDCDLKGMKAEGPGGCTCKDFPSRES